MHSQSSAAAAASNAVILSKEIVDRVSSRRPLFAHRRRFPGFDAVIRPSVMGGTFPCSPIWVT